MNVAELSLLASMKSRMPAVLVGPPGVGKTSKIYELTEKMGYELITLIGSQLDPTDIVGLPKGEHLGVDDEGRDIHGTVNLAPWWQVRILQHRKVVLFLDEITNSSPQVRASQLTMLQHREFPNGSKMPQETIVVGAMNPTDEAADGHDLDYPTTNRINFIVWSPTVAEWKEGMRKAWGNTNASTEEMEWRERIVRFIEHTPSQLQKLPSFSSSPEAYGVDPNNASEMEVLRYAWPSRRSWDNLSKTLPFANGNTVVEDTLAQGMVGYAAAADFRDWLTKNSTISPVDLMKNPKTYDWRTANISEAKSLIRSLVEYSKNEKYSTRVIAVFEELANQGQHALAAGDMRELARSATSKEFSKEVIEHNRARLVKLSQSFKSVAEAMR